MRPKPLFRKYLVVLALAAPSAPAAAQARVAIPGGVLRGVVQDSAGVSGLGYALVTLVGAERRTFASENGSFQLADLRPGIERIRVQQIGYAPVELAIQLVDPRLEPAASDRLVLRLGRRIQVLPEVIVEGDRGTLKRYRQPKGCQAPPRAIIGRSASLVIDQAVTNADRLLAMERDYPFVSTFEHVRQARDPTDRVRQQGIDTVSITPRRRLTYRRGQVLVTRGRSDAEAYYFAVADLAREEFQKAHCAWYVGTDSVEGRPVHRVDFEPARPVKSPDWAGTLSFDRETFLLIRSDAWLVNLDPRRRSGLDGARCAVGYEEVVPTLVHEKVALCLVGQTDRELPSVTETYRLLQTHFLERRPGETR